MSDVTQTEPLPVRDFPLGSTQRLISFLRGDRTHNRVQLATAVYDLLGWGLGHWQVSGSEVETLVASPMASEEEELALALDGLMQSYHPESTARPPTPPPWLLPLVAELLERAMER